MKNLIVIFCILITPFCYGQVPTFEHKIDDNSHFWGVYTGTIKVAKHWGIHSEFQWRRHNFIQSWQQNLSRIGVNYHLNDNVILTAGYGYIQTFPYGSQPINHFDKVVSENRLWQQLQLNHSLGRFSFNHRYRLEQRWTEKWLDKNQQDGYLYTNRFRYFVRATVPISKSKLEPKAFFLTAFNELFINFGHNIKSNVFDQNRFFVGLGYQLTKSTSFQMGYLNQLIEKSNGILFENNHTLLTMCTLNLDCQKNASKHL